VLPVVDKVIVVWGERPFAGVKAWMHKGKVYNFPEKFDNLVEVVESYPDDRVHLFKHHIDNPRNQWTRIVNEIVIPEFGKPDIAIMGHVTHVWEEDAIRAALEEFKTSRYRCANTWQVETWRGLDTRIPERFRAGAGFWNLRDVGEMPPTWLDFNPSGTPLSRLPMLCGKVHNLRYSQNPNIMFWRHLVVQAYVSKLGDSRPDPNHFDDKWLTWTPATRNIEMAAAHAHTVPEAVPYDTSCLPHVIQRDLPVLQAKTSNEVWEGYPECES